MTPNGDSRAPATFRQGVATTPDDMGLTYRVYGDTGTFLVCANGLGVSTFFWEVFAASFAPRHRVVLWDYLGHGRSSDPPDGSRATIAAFAEDEITVMDAVGAGQAVLLGHSMGTQVNFELCRRHAGRVLALIPTLGTYGRAVETFFGQPAIARRVAKLASRTLPRLERVLPLAISPLVRRDLLERLARLTHIVDPHGPPLREYFEHMTRLDYRVFGNLVGDLLTHDAADVLPALRVPTLIIGAERDLFVPIEVARRMATMIQGSELEILPGGTHAALFEQSALFHARVERFLAERVAC